MTEMCILLMWAFRLPSFLNTQLQSMHGKRGTPLLWERRQAHNITHAWKTYLLLFQMNELLLQPFGDAYVTEAERKDGFGPYPRAINYLRAHVCAELIWKIKENVLQRDHMLKIGFCLFHLTRRLVEIIPSRSTCINLVCLGCESRLCCD